MTKLKPESKKELYRIMGGVALCTAVMWVIFAALHVAGFAPFDYRVLLGGVVGAAVAVGNFWGLCVTVQKVTAETDEKRRRMRLQSSYQIRLLLQAAWVVIAIVTPCFHFAAGICPLVFPRVTIYYLQITGKYRPAAAGDKSAQADDPCADDAPAASDEKGGET